MWFMNEDEYIAKFCGGSRERFENKVACKMLKLYDRRKYDDGTAGIVYADYANQTYVVVIGRK